jgi:hypothetical protein
MSKNIFNQDDLGKIYIRQQPENFFEEDEEVIFNIQNANNNIDYSLNNPNNKKSEGSIKTNVTFGEINLKEDQEFSFFSLNNDQNNNFNKNEKKKELTKDSIDILKNFISLEKLMISNVNNVNEDKVVGIQNNFANNISIKDIKYNLFGVDNKVSAYFKKPYMRKNVKRNKSVIKNIFDEEQQDEDEKIKFDEKDLKMEDIKDDDSKTNNDSIEETCNFFDKKKNQ